MGNATHKAVSSDKTMSNNTVAQTMSSNNAMSKAVSDKTVSSVHKRSSVGNSNRVGDSMGDRVGDSVNNGVSNSMSNGSSSVGSLSGVGNLSDVAVDVVGMVVDGLDAAVGEVDRVGSLNNTSAVVGLRLGEGGSGVLVSDTVVEGVGGDLGEVRGGVADSVGHGVGHSMVDNRGSMDHRVGHSVSHGVSETMSNKAMSNKAMAQTMSSNNAMSE